MIAAVYAVYIVICIALIVVVLLQSGKGAGLGAAFGGASQTVFGSQGRASFLTKTTAGLAAAFMIMSLFLAWSSSRITSGGLMENYKESGPGPEMPTGAIPPAGGAQPMTLPDWQEEESTGLEPGAEEPSVPEPPSPAPTAPSRPEPSGLIDEGPPEPIVDQPEPSE